MIENRGTLGQQIALSDGKVHYLMLAHFPQDRAEGAYNRAAYQPQRREFAGLINQQIAKRIHLERRNSRAGQVIIT